MKRRKTEQEVERTLERRAQERELRHLIEDSSVGSGAYMNCEIHGAQPIDPDRVELTCIECAKGYGA